MYESPISITEQVIQNLVGTLNNDFETQVMMEVQRCVKVDKEELIKALDYDRRQYDRGYADGQRDAVEVVRCGECKHQYEEFFGLVCVKGVCVDCIVPEDFFCAYGERREVSE